MAVIKNLVTGIVTECNNADVIRVCKADTEHFEVSEGVAEKVTPKKTAKSTAKSTAKKK